MVQNSVLKLVPLQLKSVCAVASSHIYIISTCKLAGKTKMKPYLQRWETLNPFP